METDLQERLLAAVKDASVRSSYCKSVSRVGATWERYDYVDTRPSHRE